MTKYLEILRLSSNGLSQQNIAYSCSVSKKTVNKVLKRARELNISWPLDGGNCQHSCRFSQIC
ncbi:LuxR C-terminal-related transcriptional regulator [Alkalibacter rhizosphaerae]|uniref:LuxR C-terminal-related transcriptional regulator n=1 Tax=Alkalibacter rhizosphaerae TaxID=2815577 RepID=UPI001FF06F46|nr:LuxR C-terminal-related transcriptional regulator [Alkalibacter rhizosphaerae]